MLKLGPQRIEHGDPLGWHAADATLNEHEEVVRRNSSSSFVRNLGRLSTEQQESFAAAE